MKTNLLRYTVLSLLLIVTLDSCGPAYVGVRSGSAYDYGYYGPRTYYNNPYYGYRPRVYVTPPRTYYSRPRYYNRNYNNRYSSPRVYNSPRTYGGSRRGPR